MTSRCPAMSSLYGELIFTSFPDAGAAIKACACSGDDYSGAVVIRRSRVRRPLLSAGLLEQEQWTAALVARDFQRSIDSMERKAQAFLHANGNTHNAGSAHIVPASESGPASKHLQNGGFSILDKGALDNGALISLMPIEGLTARLQDMHDLCKLCTELAVMPVAQHLTRRS